ncbi:peptidoglycan D,D-transpeptidase FtsI family protein [Bifidobacterium sp.]|jgi:peptidoglycan glycosyltransferase|uniref:peptidoglycan D,D-transpeptidase FtsI family protein n=1 Tax=Bifidobacterium sp. TaxID=41200 RepID=UPI0025BE7530|nr:penicillin-binding transpeptidase domain-containing protein [Bifidobacterium sp.]MCH4209689.1 penicillin-binding protein 2 [Bifidobacterium sp.]MCI1224541.1 penicillin-binding protein 2 [Bifidobacterium sp.]
MNKSLRQLFTAVIVLFAILGLSSTIITAIWASDLNADSRNSRTLYHSISAPRGPILASDGTVIAKSVPVNDAFAYQRSYANGPLYAPVTGYFSITHPSEQGIEMSQASLLSGDSTALFWQKIKSTIAGDESKGASIETSIDPKLQQAAFQGLEGKDGAAVAIEVRTGRILAMASTPSYDPNQLAQHDTAKINSAYGKLTSGSNSPMLNRAIAQYYPPGSTFKTVVAAAALESGKYNPDTSIPAGASYTLPGTKTDLTNAESRANGSNGKISMEDALAYSSNTAFAQLGVALGSDAITQQAEKLGFGSSIPIDSDDSAGRPMRAIASNFPATTGEDRLALASIGQGDVLETPLQNALIASAIANGGTLMRPSLVDRVRSSDLSLVSQNDPEVMSQAFSKDTANKLNQMMQAVVTKENPNLAISGIQVAAKTGTAQIGTNNTSIDAWVIGFAPADNPKIAVAVVVHNTDMLGSYAAGPIMKQIMQEALRQ